MVKMESTSTSKSDSTSKLRLASTIILVREKNKALEVYLLKRSKKAKFMGGVYVFPGGVVDNDDKGFDEWADHIDVDQNYIKDHLGKDGYTVEETLGFCIAGIRETIEEAGAFLGSGPDKSPGDIENLSEYRLHLDSREPWFKKKIIDEGWILSLSHLKKWSHWITPQIIPKRFDTLFFIAFMPEGQKCSPDMIETEKGIWITPQKALEQNLKNSISLSPPTLATLNQIAGIPDLKALEKVLQDRPWAESITPRGAKASKGFMILMPWDPMYKEDPDIEIQVDPGKILAPGQTFSRVWNDKGAWKPIGV